MSKKAIRVSIFIVLFALVFSLCAMFPNTGDDWFRMGLAKSLTSPLALMRIVIDKWMTNNARILGNILAYPAGGNILYRDISRSIIIFLMIVFTAKASGIDGIGGLFAVSALLFTIPRELFREVYPWAAGFYNYVPPVLLILVYLHQVFKKGENLIAAFFLGFASQLFIENATLYSIALDVMLIIYWLYKKTKPLKIVWYHLVGAVIGAMLLFASPAYSGIFTSGGSYDVGGSSLLDTMDFNLTIILNSTVLGCPVILIGIPLLLIIRHLRSKNTALYLLLFGASILSIVMLIGGIPYLRIFAISWYLIIMSVTICASTGEERTKQILYMLSAAIFAGPLLIVNPIGPRCLFGSYVFLIMYMLEAAKHLEIDKRALTAISAICACAVFAYWMYRYVPVHNADKERISAIETAMSEHRSSVTVKRLPNVEYMWEPESKKIEYAYFYNTPGDFTINFQ